MAIYRNVQMSFWTDTKIVDDYTPEDRYFYLYLLTNPHTSLCGCYEISIKQVADEIGYSKETVEKLFERMSKVHKSVFYSRETKEVLLVNWNKYNWTNSEKFRKPLGEEIECVKNDEFRKFLINLYNGENTVSIPYSYGIDTTVTVTDTDKDLINLDNNIHTTEAAEPQMLDKEAQLRHDFELIYKIYPKKQGKTVAYAEYKKWVSREGKDVSGTRYHLTNKQIYYAVKKYVEQQREAGQDDYQYWKNFDTLMGRQLLDYVDFGGDG